MMIFADGMKLTIVVKTKAHSQELWTDLRVPGNWAAK